MKKRIGRFFPDTNVILSILLREERYWSPNTLFQEHVRLHRLDCTILPSVEREFHKKLDESIDRAQSMLATLIEEIKLEKAKASSQVSLGRGDVELVDRAFGHVFTPLNSLSHTEKQKQVKSYDLLLGWVLEKWVHILDKEEVVSLDDFEDVMKQSLIEGRIKLEDSYVSLRQKLHNIVCDWKDTNDFKGQIIPILADPSDGVHLGMAAAFRANNTVPTFFVTNDGPILRSQDVIKSKFNVQMTRPAFAFAYLLAG